MFIVRSVEEIKTPGLKYMPGQLKGTSQLKHVQKHTHFCASEKAYFYGEATIRLKKQSALLSTMQ